MTGGDFDEDGDVAEFDAALSALHGVFPEECPDLIELRGPVYEILHKALDDNDWSNVPEELLVVGCAGGGKTLGIGLWMHRLAIEFPGVQILVLRANRVDLVDAWQATFEGEVLNEDDPHDHFILCNGGKHPLTRLGRREYLYPKDRDTGMQSRIVPAGLKEWRRLRSTRWDVIVVQEATELERDNVVGMQRAMREQRTRGHRKRSRAVIPKRVVVMETNPDWPGHHLKKRADKGLCVEVVQRFEHNPMFWDAEKDEPKPKGQEYRDRLIRATGGVGHIFDQLVDGIWSGAHGAAFPMFHRSIHELRGRIEVNPDPMDDVLVLEAAHEVMGTRIPIKRYFGSFDKGLRNPACLQLWAVDAQGRSYLVMEDYRSFQSEEYWADRVVSFWSKHPMKVLACDHDPDWIERFNRSLHQAHTDLFGQFNSSLYDLSRLREGGTLSMRELSLVANDETALDHLGRDKKGRVTIAQAAIKRSGSRQEASNIELNRRALLPGEDGAPRLFIMHDAVQGSRPDDLDQDAPWGLAEEFESARWSTYDPDRSSALPAEALDGKCPNHALDACSYHQASLWSRTGRIKPRDQARLRPGSWELVAAQGPSRSKRRAVSQGMGVTEGPNRWR